MSILDILNDPYWNNNNKIKPNIINYEQALVRRPVRQPRQMDIERYGRTMSPRGNTGFVLRGNTPIEYTGPNFRLGQDTPLKPGYSRVQYYPSTTVLSRNTPTVPYDFMKNAKTTVPSSSLWSKAKAAGRFVGPALGVGELFLGKTIPSKVLGALGAGLSFAPNPILKGLGTASLLGAGAIDSYSSPEAQIDRSNKDFARYEEMFGTPDNPNLSNLAPSLRPLSDNEASVLQFKANEASQPEVVTPQLATAPTQEQYQAAENKVVNDTINAQNQLNEMANNLQPQPVQYKANIFGQNVYDATPDISAATENTIDQMNQAIQGVPNLYQNMLGQGGTEVGSNALANYMQLLGQQQAAKQALSEQMLAGYQEAAKRDRYQQLINDLSRATDEANYRSSLVFLPSGFSPNGGQTFTPMYLNPKPGEPAAPNNVAKYMEELKLRQALAPDNKAMNEAMTQALQAQAFADATGTNPWLYMGNGELAKQMFDKVLGPQISEGAKIRGELAKLSPETYAKMVETFGKTKADSMMKRMEKEYDLAKENIVQSANTDRANASEQNKFFMNLMNNNVNLAKQAMSDQAALERLKLTGMNNEQLARLKADLESSDPIKQVNAAAQLMNAYTRFVTPQEAQSYQSQLFPSGLPQFTDRRSP